MTIYDVFNGDADGICSLVQLRRHQPEASELITGVKRDIQLLSTINPQQGDVVNVLDVPMEKNKAALEAMLANGVKVFYCDHHASGDIPDHANLTSLVNLDANVCTSLLINGHLQGQFALWAVVGAFGDNLKASAKAVAKPLQLSSQQLDQLGRLGISITYNGYGAALEDLHFTPKALYQELVKYSSPFEFMSDNKAVFEQLENGYKNDMGNVAALEPHFKSEHAAVYVLPNEKWARRVSGVYSNDLANNFADRAHAVLTEKADGAYLVSVRAPLNNKQGAVDICSQFPSGGGRAAAAGINDLPAEQVAQFIETFQSFYKS